MTAGVLVVEVRVSDGLRILVADRSSLSLTVDELHAAHAALEELLVAVRRALADRDRGVETLVCDLEDLRDLESMVTFVDVEQRFPVTTRVIEARTRQEARLALAAARAFAPRSTVEASPTVEDG